MRVRITLVGPAVACSLLAFMPTGLTDDTAPSSEPSPGLSGSAEVLVSPVRLPRHTLDLSAFPGSATVITEEQIARSHALTVQELLARTEGVTVFDQQGFGLSSDGTVNLRGIINSSRTNALVLVDGVRQNRITGDEVHWQSIPVDQLERIEIIRGGGGLIYGEGALAGVINLLTKKGGRAPLETHSLAEIGNFGWQRYSVSGRGSSEALSYGASYTRRLAGGYREFSESRNTTVTAHTGITLGEAASAEVNVLHSTDTTGFPGGLTLAQVEQRRRQKGSFFGFFSDEIDQVALSASVALPWQRVLAIDGFWRDRYERSEDGFGDRRFTNSPSRGLHLRSSQQIVRGFWRSLITAGIELTDDKAATGNYITGRIDESNRQGYGLYVEDTITLGERLSIVGGYRYDKLRFDEDLVNLDDNFNNVNFLGTIRFEGKSPKVGLTYQVLPKILTVFTSYSRPFKSPNVDDFASRSTQFRGNTDLKPQQAHSYELGARLAAGPLTGQATWHYTRIDEEILFNQLTFKNDNFDTRRTGLELSSSIE